MSAERHGRFRAEAVAEGPPPAWAQRPVAGRDKEPAQQGRGDSFLSCYSSSTQHVLIAALQLSSKHRAPTPFLSTTDPAVSDRPHRRLPGQQHTTPAHLQPL